MFDRALVLANEGRYATAPNPMVGAVVERDGEIVGEGYHQQVGGPHAEVHALRAAGEAARGATVWVTLEPCSHHGRTPPCADALIEAGVAKVMVAHLDPDRRVAGQGVRRLRAAGIEVEVAAQSEDAVALNWRYLTSRIHHRPGVTIRWAMSLDGKIATVAGESQWISSALARTASLELRETHEAILVGSGTLLADDPRLDRRLGEAPTPNTRVILDRRLRTPTSARLFGIDGRVVIMTESDDQRRLDALAQAGAEVVNLSEVEPGAVLTALHELGIQSVVVEGGGEILGAFVAANAFDRVLVDCAPLLLGGKAAPGAVGGHGIERLAEGRRLEELEARSLGGDLIIEGWRSGCLQALCKSVAG